MVGQENPAASLVSVGVLPFAARSLICICCVMLSKSFPPSSGCPALCRAEVGTSVGKATGTRGDQ